MKPLSSKKSLENIERKHTRKFKPLPNITLPQTITLTQTQELIFKILPVLLEIETPDLHEVNITLTNSYAEGRIEQQNCTIPYNLGKSRWLRILLGQQIKRVELKPQNKDKKIDKNHIHKDISNWKTLTKEDPSTLNTFFIQPLLKLLKSKLNKKQHSIEPEQKSTITSFIKTRFSERHTIKPNLTQLKSKYEVLSHHTEADHSLQKNKEALTIERKENNTCHHRKQIRKASSTLETDKFHQYPTHMKESNTSTAISNEPDIKFPKRMRKFREGVQFRVAKSQKEMSFNDISQFFPQQKPKFYQHFNISQEQIDLKRKKFDSQFIYRKSTAPQTTKEIPPQKNESEVVEDICKVENSQSLHPLQDTLQKGFAQNHKTNKDIEQSGTLYESVYE